MISAAMLDNQDLPVSFEGAGEDDLTIIRCHDAGADAGFNGNSLGSAPIGRVVAVLSA